MSEEKSGGNPIAKAMRGICSLHGLGLFFICFLTYGSYFVYDTPGALGYGLVCNYGGFWCFDRHNPKNADFVNKNFANVYISDDDQDTFDHTMCSGDCWLNDTTNQYSITWDSNAPKAPDVCHCPMMGGKLLNPELNLSRPFSSVSNLTEYVAHCNLPCKGSDPNVHDSTDPSFYCGGYENYTGTPKQYAILNKYECPAQTIQMAFKEKGMNYTFVQNNILYLVYSYPNMALALCGGVLIDKFGLKQAALLFLFLVALGEVLFVIGIQTGTYWLMVVGRVVFGFGGESLSVSQSSYCARWFRNTGYMAVAFGITLSFSRIGSATTFLIVPYLATKSLSLATWVGAGATIFSLLCGVVLAFLDSYAEKKELIEAKVETDEPFKFRDIAKFSLQFWLISLICVFFYISVFPFNSIAKNFFHDKWQVDMVTAGSYVSVYTFFSAAGSPIVGMLMDRVGYPLFWMMLGCGIIVGAMALMWLTTLSPIFCMCLVGLSITLLGASMWPAVPFIVDKRVVGSAYGLMTSVQNIGLGTMPLILAVVIENNKSSPHKYYVCLWILGATGTMALVCCFALMIVDKARGGVMMMSSADRKLREKAEEDENAKLVNA